MPAAAARRSQEILRDFAREPGRTAAVRVRVPGEEFTAAAGGELPQPAASLLKVPLALAVEDAIRDGLIDPAARTPASRITPWAVSPGPVSLLSPQTALSGSDILGLALAASDNACAGWLLDLVGLPAVIAQIGGAHCTATTVSVDDSDPAGPLLGSTTAEDAVRLMAAIDSSRHPLTARALRNTLHNSRIPLGAVGLDVEVAHKTGSLSGVANDAAIITCDGGSVLIAFLSSRQHDTLVTGYEMGLATRGILQAWGLGVRHAAGLL